VEALVQFRDTGLTSLFINPKHNSVSYRECDWALAGLNASEGLQFGFECGQSE
jgi:hypothetical protein